MQPSRHSVSWALYQFSRVTITYYHKLGPENNKAKGVTDQARFEDPKGGSLPGLFPASDGFPQSLAFLVVAVSL